MPLCISDINSESDFETTDYSLSGDGMHHTASEARMFTITDNMLEEENGTFDLAMVPRREL